MAGKFKYLKRILNYYGTGKHKYLYKGKPITKSSARRAERGFEKIEERIAKRSLGQPFKTKKQATTYLKLRGKKFYKRYRVIKDIRQGKHVGWMTQLIK